MHEDFHWRYRRGAILSSERAVIVRNHPLLANLAVTVTPPAYTRSESRTLERLPAWIEVPVGSRVDLVGEANGELAGAILVAGPDSTTLRVAGNGVRGTLRVDRDPDDAEVVFDGGDRGLVVATPAARPGLETMVAVGHDPRTPRELYTIDGDQARRLTHHNPGLADIELAEVMSRSMAEAPVTTQLGLGFLILIPVSFLALYCSYRAIFH